MSEFKVLDYTEDGKSIGFKHIQLEPSNIIPLPTDICIDLHPKLYVWDQVFSHDGIAFAVARSKREAIDSVIVSIRKDPGNVYGDVWLIDRQAELEKKEPKIYSLDDLPIGFHRF